MVTVWNYFPTFVDHDDSDEQRTSCKTSSELLECSPVKNHLKSGRLYLWSDGTEDFSGVGPIQDVLFQKMDGRYYGAIVIKSDSGEEFQNVLRLLNVKLHKW